MKKFEEEFDKNVDVVEIQLYESETVIKSCNPNQVKALGHGWVSPEDHQNTVASNKAYEKSNRTLSEENAKFVVENIELQKQVAELKSQLEKQQPEIPEVPQFVADWLDKKPLYAINGSIPVEIIGWSQKQTGYADLGMNINHLLKLKVNGYTVAKEKRFYLKNKLTGLYLYKNDERFSECEEGSISWTLFKTEFTQQEIDSMAAESYEQIEVGDD